jgi:hypothetical protein
MSRSDNDNKNSKYWELDTTYSGVIEKINYIISSSDKIPGSACKYEYMVDELKVLKEKLSLVDILIEKNKKNDKV